MGALSQGMGICTCLPDAQEKTLFILALIGYHLFIIEVVYIKILTVRVYFECQSGSMQDLNSVQTVQIRVQLG